MSGVRCPCPMSVIAMMWSTPPPPSTGCFRLLPTADRAADLLASRIPACSYLLDLRWQVLRRLVREAQSRHTEPIRHRRLARLANHAIPLRSAAPDLAAPSQSVRYDAAYVCLPKTRSSIGTRDGRLARIGHTPNRVVLIVVQ